MHQLAEAVATATNGLPMTRRHYAVLKDFLFRPARVEAVDFKENVIEWIMLCRVDDGGIPMFRTHFAKAPFREDETLYAMGVCYMGKNMVSSQWFRDVPRKDFMHLERSSDDYLYLLRSYSPDKLEEAVKAPVVVV